MIGETRPVNGEISSGRRFLISSLPTNARQMATAVRNMLNTAKNHFKGLGIKALRKKADWGNDRLQLILKHIFCWDSPASLDSGVHG